VALIPARLSDNQSQVGVDHAFLGRQVAALNALGQLDLLGRRQKRVDPGPAKEQSQRIGGRRRGVLGIQLGPMDSPPPGLPGGSSRIIARTTTLLARLFNLAGVVLAAVSRLNLTTVLKTVNFGCS
jgi:hypothetical protein